MGFAIRGISRVAVRATAQQRLGGIKCTLQGAASQTFLSLPFLLAGAQILFLVGWQKKRLGKIYLILRFDLLLETLLWKFARGVKGSLQFFTARLGFNFSDDSICFNGPAAGHLSRLCALSLSVLLLYEREREDSRGMKGAALLSPANGSAACVSEPLAGNFCLFAFKGSEINALAK